jgi:hypothetical protein
MSNLDGRLKLPDNGGRRIISGKNGIVRVEIMIKLGRMKRCFIRLKIWLEIWMKERI